MSNFVDYGNMTSLMTAIKTAIDNAGGGGGNVGWSLVPASEITSMADIKIGDILFFSYTPTSVPGTRHKIKFSAASSASATISGTMSFGPSGYTGAVVVNKSGSSANLALSNPGIGSGQTAIGGFTLTSLTSGTAVQQAGIDSSFLGTSSGSNAYSLYIRTGGSFNCSVSDLLVYRVKAQ